MRSGVAFGLRSVPRVRDRAFVLRSAPDARAVTVLNTVYTDRFALYGDVGLFIVVRKNTSPYKAKRSLFH